MDKFDLHKWNKNRYLQESLLTEGKHQLDQLSWDFLLRALPGVTTVTLASGDGEYRETFKVKLISQKEATEAFNAFKTNAMNKYSFIKDIEIAENTIEDK